MGSRSNVISFSGTFLADVSVANNRRKFLLIHMIKRHAFC